MKKKKFFYLILSLGTFVFMNFYQKDLSSNAGWAIAYYSGGGGLAQNFGAGAGGSAGAWVGLKWGARIGSFWGPVGMIVGGGIGAA